jgi:protease-4
MRRVKYLFCVLLWTAGCLGPIETNSRITLTRPLTAQVTAELQLKSSIHPVVEMPVEGPARGPSSDDDGRTFRLARCVGHWLHQRHGGEEEGLGGPKVAIVDVDGLLLNENVTGLYAAGDNPVDLFREKLDAVAADPQVCAVVLRINSPGGAVTATDVMWRELQAFRARTERPVVACLMDLGCGGAYYLATASDLLIAHPTTVTGGIGVVLNLYNLRDLMGVFRIVTQFIKAGANIDMGTQIAALPPKTRQLLQAMADEFHERFKAVVLERRRDVDLAGGTTFDGRVFTAREALQRRLIDQIGYLDDALGAARKLGGQPTARAVLFHRCNDVARTPYAISPNQPLQNTLFPASVPGIERSRLPAFLYLWQPEPTLERVRGT